MRCVWGNKSLTEGMKLRAQVSEVLESYASRKTTEFSKSAFTCAAGSVKKTLLKKTVLTSE